MFGQCGPSRRVHKTSGTARRSLSPILLLPFFYWMNVSSVSAAPTADCTNQLSKVGTSPTAENDSVSTTAGTAISATLCGNLTANPSPKYVLVQGKGPQNGQVSKFDSDTGDFTYTPNTNFSGTDKFTFQIDSSHTADETVHVTPTAISGSIIIPANSPGEGVLSGSGSGITFALSSDVASQPKHGTVSLITGTNKFSYTPTDAKYTGQDTFVFVVTDSSAQSVTASETVTITSAQAGTVGGGYQQETISDFLSKGDWGVGLALVVNDGKVVPDATIINNKVRANTVEKARTELVAAYHWYFASNKNDATNEQDVNPDGTPRWHCTKPIFEACTGAFIALGVPAGSSSDSTQVPDLVAIGGLLGWGQAGSDIESQPYNFGIGVGYRLGVKTLGDGFRVDAAPPPGETTVPRYVNKDIWCYLMFFTYTWGK